MVMAFELGRLEYVDPREYWKHEARDFTPWLRDNIDGLATTLGIELDPAVESEVGVGPFSADIVARDLATNSIVLVENQLEPTDHSHLGQLVTYASGLGASQVVWIARTFRDEHRQALIWLNERTTEDLRFFGIEIELVKIGESAMAPNFRVVVEPNEWQKTGARIKSQTVSDRGQLYYAFWQKLIEDLQQVAPGFTSTSPDNAPTRQYCTFTAGRSGFSMGPAFGWDSAAGYQMRVELYIDTRDFDTNKHAFDLLEAQRQEVEAELGLDLIWTRRDDIRASRIRIERPGGIEDDADALAEHRAWMIDKLVRMRNVFADRVKSLELNP
jgi:hypothetical protein